MSHLTLNWLMTSSLWPPNSKFQFAYYDVIIFLENWLYLCKYWSIFIHILIWFSWDNSLQMQSPRIFILTKASWRIFAIKGGMSIFYILRVFLMGHDFFWKLDSTFPSFTSNISVVSASFSLSIEYVVAETISYHKCSIYFSIRCRIMLIFHLQSGIWEFHFLFTCNRHGKCSGIFGNALDFGPRDPWFESGSLQQFFFFIFFSFLTFQWS